MSSSNFSTKKDAASFARFLKEEGVSEVYIPKTSVRGSRSANESSAAAIETSAGGSVKDQLLALREKVLKCTLCEELATTRKNTVFGSGNIKAKLVFVGEAPGRDEDEQGLPFVGRAGQLLTKIIESIGLERKQVFICNVLKCRPPQNRQPQPDEILNCHPFLMKQLELIQPRIICALGTFASQTLLKTDVTISQLRGRFQNFPHLTLSDSTPIKVMCTYHPAYLLRNPAEKRKVWEDMKMIKKELDSLE